MHGSVFPLTLTQFRAQLEIIQQTSYRDFTVIFRVSPLIIVIGKNYFTITSIDYGTVNPQFNWEARLPPELRRTLQALKLAHSMSQEDQDINRLRQLVHAFINKQPIELHFSGQAQD